MILSVPLGTGPQFTWVAVKGIVHAFTGRTSLCWNARLPKNWLQAGREGAVCFGCSKTLRDHKTVKKFFGF